MKFKASRASLVAIVSAALFMSLIPLTRADSGANSAQQQDTAHPRRGKNGQSTPSVGTQLDATRPIQEPAQDAKAEAKTTKTSTPSGKPQSDTTKDDRWISSSNTTGAVDSAATQQSDAPPFDRPPASARSRARTNSADRSAPSQSSQQPGNSGSYSRNDSRGRSTGSQQNSTSPTYRDRSQTASSGNADRSSGQPPVLQRPSDSRQRDGIPADSNKPPVLRRPSDVSRDDGSSQDVRTGRPYPQGSQEGTGKQPAGDDEVVKLESTLVNIPLLVSDRSGRYIPQLSGRDFLLYEDGVQQTIASFGSEEVPFSVVLLLDVSPSVQGSVSEIQDAAIEFVRQLRSQDRVMVVSFDRRMHYLSDFTSDRRELESAIRRANTGGGTSVYDAVYEVVESKLRNIEGRKALILFSDGEDTTSSHASYDDAVDLVGESDVLVYGLRYPGNGGGGGGGRRGDPRIQIPNIPIPLPFPWPWPNGRRRRGPFTGSNVTDPGAAPQSWPRRRSGGGDFMADITAAGGGPVYDAEHVGDMSRLAARIAEELRHVYVISYYPTNPLSNGGFRKIRVSVKNRDDIAVRHRPGYNARPGGNAKPTI